MKPSRNASSCPAASVLLSVVFGVGVAAAAPSPEGNPTPTANGSTPTATAAQSTETAAIGTAADSYEPPRTTWGTPDLSGTWDFRTLTPFERPASLAGKAVLTPEEARRFQADALDRVHRDNREDVTTTDVEGAYNDFWWDYGKELTEDLRTSLIVDPADGRLPELTEAARAGLAEANRTRPLPVRDLFSYSFSEGPTAFVPDGPDSVGLSERCLVGFNAGPPMRPSAYNNNLEIVQTHDHVVLVTEMIHDARIVPLDGRPRLPAEIVRWSGDSRGHWEGDTLVVETTHFNPKKAVFQVSADPDRGREGGAAGVASGLKLTERFTRVADGQLLYEFTVDAPETFTQPFTVAVPMNATEDRMFEYACHEGNYAMGGMLRGARLRDDE